MGNNFFKNVNKAYAENLNDCILVSNGFDWNVTINLPTDTSSAFPSSNNKIKAKVVDVNITPNSNLSIGSTIENNSNSIQVYRLTVYPNFNRFNGFKSINLTGDGTFYIANKGDSNPISDNLDYTNLSNVPELKVLKEYDIVVIIPSGGEVSGLSFVLQSDNSGISASLDQSNIMGLSSSLDSKVNILDVKNNLNSTDINKPLSSVMGNVLQSTKVDKETGKGLSTNDFTNMYENTFGKNNWVKMKTKSEDITLYFNPLLRIVDFKFYRTGAYINSEETFLDICTESYGTPFSPKMDTPLASYNVKIKGIVKPIRDGFELYGFCDSEALEPKTLNFRGMWHY